MDEQMEQHNEPQASEAELARLADGSLSASREAQLRDEVARSPALARALADQKSVVAMLRGADPTAPASLHRQIEAMTAAATQRRRPRPWSWPPRRLVLPATAALAAVVAVVVALSVGSSVSGPTLSQTARLALASATAAAPSPANRTELSLSVAGIPFPNWGRSIGWRALGSRADTIGGQRIATVYYGGAGGYRVGYSIVSGSPVPVKGGSSVLLHGIRYVFASDGPVRLVTWLRSGHTCVIAGQGITRQALLGLAEVA